MSSHHKIQVVVAVSCFERVVYYIPPGTSVETAIANAIALVQNEPTDPVDFQVTEIDIPSVNVLPTQNAKVETTMTLMGQNLHTGMKDVIVLYPQETRDHAQLRLATRLGCAPDDMTTALNRMTLLVPLEAVA